MAGKKEIEIVDFKNLPVDFNSTDVEVTDKALDVLKEKYSTVPKVAGVFYTASPKRLTLSMGEQRIDGNRTNTISFPQS